MTNDIFKLEEGLLVLDKEYIRSISEFRIILERDKGSEGDATGRLKKQAFKEFYYLYVFASPFAYPRRGGYTDKEAHEAAIKESGFDIKFKPDKDLKICIDKYREILKAIMPEVSTLEIVTKTLRLSQRICLSINESLEESLELMEKSKKEKKESGEPSNIAADILLNDQLITKLDQVVKIANKLPDTIKTLENSKTKIIQEEISDNMARGGKKIGNRADPTRRR